MFQKFCNTIKNASLAKKILYILSLAIFFLAISILVGFLIITRSSNQILYQTSAQLLSYSTKNISNHLSSAKDMADFIMSDATIQRELGRIKDESSNQTPTDSYSNIHATLDTYHQRYKSNYVDNIQIVTPNFTVTSYSMDSHIVPSSMLQDLITEAKLQDGRSLWITRYADPYGIFLVKSIRRIEHLKLDELGVLLININLNKMMEDISASEDKSNAVSYLLNNGEQQLYNPKNGIELTTDELDQLPEDSYNIQTIDNKQFFIVPATIPETGWTCYCLAPYENMYNDILAFQRLFFVILLCSLLLCIILTKMLIKPILAHFNVLINKIKKFGNEDFEIMEIPYSYEDRHDEIGMLHQQFDSMALKIQTLIRENYETNLVAKDAQLKALEMQINPHFLYNTLQSINWRAKMLKDTEISSMTEALGKLLRITLSNKNKDSSLRQELELVQYYMTIQKIRYDGRLTYETDVPEDLLETYLPKFTLQPLVENAIHYTLKEDSDNCLIRICAKCSDSCLTIRVANTDSQFETNLLNKLLSGEILPHGFGIGILNVWKRLSLTFDKNYTLDFYNENEFAIACISIPANRKDD